MRWVILLWIAWIEGRMLADDKKVIDDDDKIKVRPFIKPRPKSNGLLSLIQGRTG